MHVEYQVRMRSAPVVDKNKFRRNAIPAVPRRTLVLVSVQMRAPAERWPDELHIPDPDDLVAFA